MLRNSDEAILIDTFPGLMCLGNINLVHLYLVRRGVLILTKLALCRNKTELWTKNGVLFEE